MSKIKYMPRVNKFRGINSIKEEFITENFGKDYILVWTGDNHFAKNKKTGKFYYIFKKEKKLLPVEEFSKYYLEKNKRVYKS